VREKDSSTKEKDSRGPRSHRSARGEKERDGEKEITKWLHAIRLPIEYAQLLLAVLLRHV
jgi:hypothetical protein